MAKKTPAPKAADTPPTAAAPAAGNSQAGNGEALRQPAEVK